MPPPNGRTHARNGREGAPTAPHLSHTRAPRRLCSEVRQPKVKAMRAADDTTRQSPLAHTRSGAGEPLVLLHGIGSSGKAWNPVIPLLAARFDVIVVDLPGFGDSAPLPGHSEPHPAAIAGLVAQTLDDLGIRVAARRRQLARRLGRARARRHHPCQLDHPVLARWSVARPHSALQPDQPHDAARGGTVRRHDAPLARSSPGRALGDVPPSRRPTNTDGCRRSTPGHHRHGHVAWLPRHAAAPRSHAPTLRTGRSGRRCRSPSAPGTRCCCPINRATSINSPLRPTCTRWRELVMCR